MDPHLDPETTGDRGPVRPPRLTRRRFLRGSVILGAVALAALRGEAVLSRDHDGWPDVAALDPTTNPRLASATGAQGTPVGSAQPPSALGQNGPGAATRSSASPAPIAGQGFGGPAASPGGTRQPNVLLVTIDTLRADRIGPYGFATARTPVLDQLAREGVRFDHAICQLPQTDPSHAALMTGLYASTNGVKIHMVDKLRSGTQTFASLFLTAGYQTAGIYSWVSLDPQFCGLNQGFQTYEGYVINRGAIFSNPVLEQIAATYRQVKATVPIVKTADAVLGASSDYEETLDGRADVTNHAVFQWLDAHAAAGPFFLWVHYFDPHYPYAPPAGYDHLLGLDYHGSIDGTVDTIHKIQSGQLTPNAADLARLEELYQGEIAFTDAQLGQLLDRLTTLGVADDTIVTVAGDHGESFGEHGDWTHGLKVFETEIRVPLLMRYPRRLPAGARVSAPAQLIDVLPTLVELAGLDLKQPVQGSPLMPLLGGADDGSDRAAFTELADEAFVSVLSMGDWKLIRNDANGQLQLYNLNVDEAEQQDLTKGNPRTTSELSARLQDLMKISGVSK